MEPLTEDQVLDRARDWAHLHKNPKTRGDMDKLLEGLSKPDQRRVYLCGQRIAGGLPYKVLPRVQPPTKRKEVSDGKPNQGAQRRKAAAAEGSPAPEKKKAVGAAGVPPQSSNRRSRSSRAE